MYAFRCTQCGHQFEELVSRFGGTAPCPKCQATDVERLVSAPAARVSEKLRAGARVRSGCTAPPGTGFS